MRKLASHCGGVPPTAQLKAFNDTPWVADPGNGLYASIVQRLLDHVNLEATSPEDIARIDLVRKLNVEHKADLIEAALAAANAAHCIETSQRFAWTTMVGGACGTDDDITRWLVKCVHWESKRS